MSEQTYTFGEAAAQLGIREDDLGALLPDAGLDAPGRDPQHLTASEIQRLARLFTRIQAMHREEGPYSPS
jgi:hypothetical protein